MNDNLAVRVLVMALVLVLEMGLVLSMDTRFPIHKKD